MLDCIRPCVTKETTTRTDEATRIITATALVSGLRPKRNIDQISTGSVVSPTPLVKDVTTNSSNETVNAINAPATMPGINKGSVT